MTFRLLFYILLLGMAAGQTSRAGTLQLPKTGQVKIYAAGDDGALQKGMAVPAPRYVDNNDGTVADTLTGLTWLKNANCFGSQTWENALTSATSLATGSCNLNDGSVPGGWRMPNANELQSLMDLANNNPSLQTGHPFIAVINGYYWTSTTVVDVPTEALCISTGVGYSNSLRKSELYFVWPVRGGRTSLSISKNGSGTGSIAPSSGNIDWSGFFGTAGYALGTSVTLSASPASGSTFSGWSGCTLVMGDSCSVTLDQAKHVLATFSILPPTITGVPSASATVGDSYSFVPGSTNATSFSLRGTIPPGMSFDVASGVVSGAPTTAGTYSDIVITASNASGSASLNPFSITVAKATPSIKALPTGSNITFGQALSASTFTGGAASVLGSFAFTTPAAVPAAAGNTSAEITFTPTDTANYNSVSARVMVMVLKATPTITTLPTASSITFGQALSSSTLTGGTASVPGSFAFTSPSTIPTAGGTYSAAVTFTPADGNHNSVNSSVTVTVIAKAVNGACGPSHGKSFAVMPTAYLCSSGQVTSVTGTGPWSWSCSGTDGGSTQSCSASNALPPTPPVATATKPSADFAAVKTGTTFTVYRTGGGATNAVVQAGSDTSFTDTSPLQPNTIYQYAVASDSDPSLTNLMTIRTPLYNGWNIIAIPYATAGMNPSAFFGSTVSSIYQWISSGATTEDSNAPLGSYVTVSSLASGNGYFVKAANNSTLLAYSGAQGPASVTVTLKPGWTMIANPNTVTKTDIGTNWLVGNDKLGLAIVQGKIAGGIYWWNGTTYDSWSILQQNPQIEPWKGYWMLNLDNVPHTLTIQ